MSTLLFSSKDFHSFNLIKPFGFVNRILGRLCISLAKKNPRNGGFCASVFRSAAVVFLDRFTHINRAHQSTVSFYMLYLDSNCHLCKPFSLEERGFLQLQNSTKYNSPAILMCIQNAKLSHRYLY